MPLKPCLDCGRLSDQSRCPPCRGTRNRQRDQQRGGTTARSYGTQHQRRRAELLPSAYGQPCARCLELMLPGQDLDLDHSNPADKLAGEPGDRITHAACNRGGRKSSDV